MKDTNKKVITITGGAGGIGMACAKALSDYRLVITDYSRQAVDKTLDALSALQIDAVGFACDITDEQAVNRLKDFTAEQGQFMGVVHTAGVSGTVRDPEKVFKIDLLGTDLIADAFFSLAQAGSVIILFSSMMGHTIPSDEAYDETLRHPKGKNAYKQLALFIGGSSDRMYDFAKRGVQLICRDNAMRYGQKGARIVSVSPGIIMTPMAQKAAEEHPERMQRMKEMTPLRRNGQPEDIADVVKFLLSKDARFITGTDILVDGGMLTQLTKNNLEK
ncbi:MAG: SDR family oxidoreductase [Saprospiraceae bacterium]|nr:SDR family oxidoreductase [Lewinella sp.]MCB0664439.1 SDR family oxidoreductase [Saprospiraceae bacterium]